MRIPGSLYVLHPLRYAGWPLFLHFTWDLLIALAYWLTPASVTFPNLPVSLLGSAVVVCLSFRNTTAYSRWWEARTLLGGLVNSSRTFTRQILTMWNAPRAMQREVLMRHVAYVQALRLHLRGQSPWSELESRLNAEELQSLRTVNNVPNAILTRTAKIIRANVHNSVEWASFEVTLTAFSNAQGGMERIRNTPLPVQFGAYPVILTHAFCLLLPLGLVESLGLYLPLGSTAVVWLFLNLLRNGDDMKNPFGNTKNDVPLTALTQTIEIDILDILHDPQKSRPLAPINEVIW